YQIKITDLKDGHRDYLITCTIYSVETGKRLGSGSGSCSTMESKYRYRNVADYQVTDLPIPKDSKEKKAEYRKQGFGMKKVDGLWVWVKFTDSSKQENPDIADVYNTALKMGQKRAFVAAILTVLAVSDMFTQDIEDSLPEKEIHPPSGPIPENMDPKTGEEIEPKKPENVPNEEKTPEEALNILKAAISDLRFSKEPDEKKIELARKFLANWKTRKYSKTIMDSGLKEIKNLLGNLGEEEVLF
ncbi:MAG: hypothetical protein OEY34_08660, partial [Cyclobacteriaceae bacterium]|nr:hypothetical protein [Cyclobacteriaceae bacterium]